MIKGNLNNMQLLIISAPGVYERVSVVVNVKILVVDQMLRDSRLMMTVESEEPRYNPASSNGQIFHLFLLFMMCCVCLVCDGWCQ